MAHYFSYVSNFNYISLLPEAKISDYIIVKNLFKRGKINDTIFSNLAYFEKYSIQGDERADQIADAFYNDPTLDWIVFLSNNVINVEDEWPLPSYVFDSVMLSKYGTYENLYNGIHHYQTNEITNSNGIVMLKEKVRVSKDWKTNGNFIEVINSKIDSLSTTGTTCSITMVNRIMGLKVGDQVTISNISENGYNGQFIITNLTDSVIVQKNGKNYNNVKAFQFEFSPLSIPANKNPVLAIPRTEEVHFTLSDSSELTANSWYYEFYDEGLEYTVHVPKSTFVRSVTNYEYEMDREDAKRNIYLLKPQYLNILFQDIDNLMRYKKSSQYESRTLKRGDNIRLYQ